MVREEITVKGEYEGIFEKCRKAMKSILNQYLRNEDRN